VHELLPGIWTWSWFSERHGYDFHGYFVEHETGNLCVDPVEPSAETLAELERRGVARILLTNRNHTRASSLVRERTRARLAIHSADAPHAAAQGVVADESLAVGERVGPFEIIAAAGKSLGEVALYDRARRILIVGDACVGKPPGALALLAESVIDDLPALRVSLLRIAATLDVETLLPGDGAPILADAGSALRALVSTFPG
jgi:glyoxylase-like metal-dependent hydrolase (beta-lactamase superfamily II)